MRRTSVRLKKRSLAPSQDQARAPLLEFEARPAPLMAGKRTMKVLKILSVTALITGLGSTGPAVKYDGVVAKGYRWVTVDGPYACVSKDDLRQLAKSHSTETELQMVKNQRAYYLLQGDIVKVIRQDAASGLSLIRVAGIPKDLWTF